MNQGVQIRHATCSQMLNMEQCQYVRVSHLPTRTQTSLMLKQPSLSTLCTHSHSHQFIPSFPSIPLQLCVSRSIQLGLLANVRGVSHGSPPCVPAPAVLFMSSAGENEEEEDGFFRVGVTHSIWQHTMRHFTIFLMLAHNKSLWPSN